MSHLALARWDISVYAPGSALKVGHKFRARDQAGGTISGTFLQQLNRGVDDSWIAVVLQGFLDQNRWLCHASIYLAKYC